MNFVNNFDVIFCSETWQRKNDTFVLDGYECVDVPRKASVSSKRVSNRGHGGVCLFIKENIKNGLHIVETNDDGLIWVKFDKLFFNIEHDIYICFVYIPP